MKNEETPIFSVSHGEFENNKTVAITNRERTNTTLPQEIEYSRNEEKNAKSIDGRRINIYENNTDSNNGESVTTPQEEITEIIERFENKSEIQNEKFENRQADRDLTKIPPTSRQNPGISELSLFEEKQNTYKMFSKDINNEEHPTTIIPQGDEKFPDQSNTPLMKHTKEDTSAKSNFCGYFCINETLCISLNISIALFINVSY